MRLRNAAGFEGGVVVEVNSEKKQPSAARVFKGLFRMAITLAILAAIGYGIYYLFVQYRPMAVAVCPIAEISVESTGKIAEIYVKQNDQVKMGQPLFRISDDAIKLSIAQATATLESRKKDLTAAKEDIRIRKFDMDAKHTDKLLSLLVDEEDDHTKYVENAALYARLKEEGEFRKRDMERITELHGKGVVGVQELDAAKTAYKSRADELEQLTVSLERSKERYQNSVKRRQVWSEMIPSIDSAILLDACQARIDEAQTQLDTLQKSSELLTIRSPCDGQVIRLSATAGQVALAGQALMAINPGNPAAVEAYIEEQYIADYPAGQKVTLQSLDGKHQFDSTITQIAPDVVQIPPGYLPTTAVGIHFGRLVNLTVPPGTKLLADERLTVHKK